MAASKVISVSVVFFLVFLLRKLYAEMNLVIFLVTNFPIEQLQYQIQICYLFIFFFANQVSFWSQGICQIPNPNV